MDTEKTKQESVKTEYKQYIKGAGACIVSKSLLNGTSKLKWLFREDGGVGNGWVAFGDTDTQEYIDSADHLAVVDFNVLANIEPAALNVFFMPIGTDLEFRSDESGKYFVDTRTGEEIREPVKCPTQEAFEKNLKFLNRKSYPIEFFQGLFRRKDNLQPFVVGEVDFPTGEVALADPLVYLGTKYQTNLERRIPVGSYPVELSICRSRLAGLRIAAARLKISGKEAVNYEIAMPKGAAIEDFGKQGVFTFFGVDAGLACFADDAAAKEFDRYFAKWHEENPDKNQYDDYFADLFQKSYEAYPELQRKGGDFLLWHLPESGGRLALFSSGMGDGVYSGYWGLDAEGEIAELVVPFMNPEYF